MTGTSTCGTRAAADAVARFTDGKTLDDYVSDELFRSAVERQLQIVGEAIAQFARLDPETAKRIPEFREIIAFRNILVHGYAVLDNDIVWRVVQQDLPNLRARLDKLGEAS